MKLIKILLSCCTLVVFSGCANQPNQLILNPVYKSRQISSINNSLNTSVSDLRGDSATLKLIESSNTKNTASTGITE